MIRIITALFVAALISQPALADDSKDKNFAQYSVTGAFSLFGPAGSFGYNASRKTSYVFAGGVFSGEAPMKIDIDGNEFTADGSASWMGVFVNHRPIDSAEWFRLVAGLGIGNIDNDLKDDAGNVYNITYNENPVAYLGLGFGVEAKKGFLWGFDLGLLQTAGPTITRTAAGTGDDQTEAIGDHWMFGTIQFNVQLSLGWGF